MKENRKLAFKTIKLLGNVYGFVHYQTFPPLIIRIFAFSPSITVSGLNHQTVVKPACQLSFLSQLLY